MRVIIPADNMGAGEEEATIVAGPEGQYVLSVSGFQPTDAGVDIEVVPSGRPGSPRHLACCRQR